MTCYFPLIVPFPTEDKMEKALLLANNEEIDTYTIINKFIKMINIKPSCDKYEICLNIEVNEANKSLVNNIINGKGNITYKLKKIENVLRQSTGLDEGSYDVTKQKDFIKVPMSWSEV